MNGKPDLIASVLLVAAFTAVFIVAGAPIVFSCLFAGICVLFLIGLYFAVYG